MKTITVDRQRFGIETDPRTGTPCVSSIHPYDETEYHWARHSGDEDDFWKIYRDGKFVAYSRDYYDGADVTPEQIAEELLNLDKEAKLERRGGIW